MEVSKAVAYLLVLSCGSCGAYTFLRSEVGLQNGWKVQTGIGNPVPDDLKTELRMREIEKSGLM